jgi:PAS domain S-box-containing protein
MSHLHEAVINWVQRLVGRVRLLAERTRPLEAPTCGHECGVSIVSEHVGIGGADDRRLHEGVVRPGRRHSDRRLHATENKRVLLAGPDKAWRLLAAYVFEEAGYSVYAAGDHRQAVTSAARLLPDVVVIQIEPPDALDVPARLADMSTSNIPVVVLTSSLQSIQVHRARGRGAVTLLPHPTDVYELIEEADTLIAAAPRVQRTLKRRLLDLKELVQHYRTDAEGQERLRHLIDRLQVAILAVDEEGHCIAASEGATVLTGYSRRQLLTASVLDEGFAGGHVSDELWRNFLANRHYVGTTTITNRAGEGVAVHAAAVAEILPGFHVAAFAPTDLEYADH